MYSYFRRGIGEIQSISLKVHEEEELNQIPLREQKFIKNNKFS